MTGLNMSKERKEYYENQVSHLRNLEIANKRSHADSSAQQEDRDGPIANVNMRRSTRSSPTPDRSGNNPETRRTQDQTIYSFGRSEHANPFPGLYSTQLVHSESPGIPPSSLQPSPEMGPTRHVSSQRSDYDQLIIPRHSLVPNAAKGTTEQPKIKPSSLTTCGIHTRDTLFNHHTAGVSTSEVGSMRRLHAESTVVTASTDPASLTQDHHGSHAKASEPEESFLSFLMSTLGFSD